MDQNRACKHHFAILGFGKTGCALTRHLLQTGNDVTVIDQQEHSKIVQREADLFKHPHLKLIAPITTPIDLDQFDLVIPSPGFRVKQTLFHGSFNNIISELDYCFPFFKGCQTIAITGTNGKTTWVKLLTHLLQQQGRHVFLGGNIGTPMIEIFKGSYDTVILELSSFQLHYSKQYQFDISVLLNIADDHLTWHQDRSEYLTDKLSLLFHTATTRYCHHSVKTYMNNYQLNTPLPNDLIWFGSNEPYTIQKGQLIIDQTSYPLAPLDQEKTILGENLIPIFHYFLQQYPQSSLYKGINQFTPEPFRLNVMQYHGITFVNDSKSTNIDSLLFAIKAFPKSILILSGDDKKLDYTPALTQCLTHQMKQIVGFGEMGKKLINFFPDQFQYRFFEHLEPLLLYLKKVAIKGDTILFSPASSSFDRYRNYVDRGNDFNRLVKAIFGGL